MVSLVWRFGPPLMLMTVVWLLSAQSDMSTGLGTWDLVLRKGAHMTEFGLLFLLWLRAFRWRVPLAAAALAAGWAAVDELHQSTVTGRHGTPVDVLIDTAGVALVWALWARAGRRRRRGLPG